MKLLEKSRSTLSIAGLILMGIGCGQGDQSGSNSVIHHQSAPSFYEKYGGVAAIQKWVDDAAASVSADPETAPFFAVFDETEGDVGDHLKSCLDLEFIYRLGGQVVFPGVSHFRNAPGDGYSCKHFLLPRNAIVNANTANDKFVLNLVSVLKADGVSDEDIQKEVGLR